MKPAIAFLLLPFAAAVIGAAPSPVKTGHISVTVTELRSSDGVVRACMTPDPAKFPKCRGVEGARSTIVPASDTVRLVFEGVPPGRYAIALLHDENNNGKADRALMMMPKEGFGFSRDAKVRMGPPDFDDAAFQYDGGAANQSIRMRYLF